MGEPSPGIQPPTRPPEDRLDSWKEIAAHLGRDVTTVQRWEKREGMPVHRHLHDRMGSVYAFGSEIDAWQQSRKLRLDETEEKESLRQAPVGTIDGLASTPKPQSRRWFVLGAVIVLALVLGGYIIVRSRAREVTPPKIESLAVLPLKNLSGDPTQDYLTDGMTEALIGRLSAIRGLRLISRTSAMQYKDTKLSVPEIAKTLRVDAIVEGSLIREGNRIRVTAQLIRGTTDTHFWSETYDRELQDVLTLQSEVAQAIAARVQVTLSGEEHERLNATRTVAPEVYESYLKGQFALNKARNKAAIEESIGYFEEAIKMDSTFAPAYVGLASAYDDMGGILLGGTPDETRPKVVTAARKALALDPGIVEAHILLADIEQKEWHWAEAEAEYKRALDLSPNSALAQAGYSGWLLCQGRTEEALDWARRAREHDPLTVTGDDIAWILFMARRYDESIHELRSGLAVQPDSIGTLWSLGFSLTANGQPEEAIPVLEKVVSLSNRSPATVAILIRAYAHAGRRAEALRLLDEMKRLQKTSYVPAAAFVNAYLGLDDKEQAFVWLERAYQEKSNILQFVKVHPYFDPLRSDPRFAQLVRRMGLDRTYQVGELGVTSAENQV